MGGEIMEELYENKIIPKYKAVISAQQEYIDFLEKGNRSPPIYSCGTWLALPRRGYQKRGEN